MPPRVRKLVLTAHIVISVSWIGALAAYTTLDIAVASDRDPQTLRAAYLGMERIARSVIVPLAVAALLTGIVMSLGTKWGLFRHYWVVVSLVLTTLSTAVLLVEVQTVSSLAAAAADPATSVEELRLLGNTLAHSVGGILVLLVILVLNVYKPRGMTRYGWRKEQQQGRSTRPR